MNPIDKYCSDFHLLSYQDIGDGEGVATCYFKLDLPEDNPIWAYLHSPNNETIDATVKCKRATSFDDIFETAKKQLCSDILEYSDNLTGRAKAFKEAIDKL